MSLVLQPGQLSCMVLADCQGTRALTQLGDASLYELAVGEGPCGCLQAPPLPVIERPLAGVPLQEPQDGRLRLSSSHGSALPSLTPPAQIRGKAQGGRRVVLAGAGVKERPSWWSFDLFRRPGRWVHCSARRPQVLPPHLRGRSPSLTCLLASGGRCTSWRPPGGPTRPCSCPSRVGTCSGRARWR
jgi:hypothetical protein